MKTGYTGERGYLLIDAVVAIFIASIALVAISGLFTQSLQAISTARYYTTASAIAQEQMEVLKAKDDGFWLAVSFPFQAGPAAISGTDFYQTIRAEISPIDFRQHVVKLTVTIARPGGEQVTLVTYVLREVPQYLPIAEGL